jgi:predicted Zn-dependent protease
MAGTTACTSAKQNLQNLGYSVAGGLGIGRDRKTFDYNQSLADAPQLLSREEKYYLGRAVAAKILAKYKPSTDPALNAYVQKVGLVAASASPEPVIFGGYHFIVLESEAVNAMAAPSGHVFITRGLLKILDNEDALASVLAHEISHVNKGHGIQAVSRENLVDALENFGNLAGSFNCAEVLDQAVAIFGRAADDIVVALEDKGFARDQELEADSGAIRIMGEAGYYPPEILGVFTALQKTETPGSLGWFKTHPPASVRKAQAEALVANVATDPASAGVDKRLARFSKAVH